MLTLSDLFWTGRRWEIRTADGFAGLDEVLEGLRGQLARVSAQRDQPNDPRRVTLRLAIDTYGADAQTDMCIEEMSELIKALLKLRRYWNDAPLCDIALYNTLLVEIREEVADVQIMLDQMRMIYGDTDEVEARKIDRLARRLRDEEAKT